MQTSSEHIYLQQTTFSTILMIRTHAFVGNYALRLNASRSLPCFFPKQCDTKHSDFFLLYCLFWIVLFSLHHKHARSADTAIADRGCKHISSEVVFSIRLARQQRGERCSDVEEITGPWTWLFIFSIAHSISRITHSRNPRPGLWYSLTNLRNSYRKT